MPRRRRVNQAAAIDSIPKPSSLGPPGLSCARRTSANRYRDARHPGREQNRQKPTLLGGTKFYSHEGRLRSGADDKLYDGATQIVP